MHLTPWVLTFANVAAPRRLHPTTFQSLAAILLSTIRGTLGGAQNWVEIEQWGQAQQAWLSACRALPHGIPSHDTFGRGCALLAPASRPPALVAWRSALVARGPESMALDGQGMRRALDRAEGQGPLPVVSAWASHKELGLAQGNVEAKSNASTALPALLALRNLEGHVGTSDARGCPVEIARQSSAHGGA
jgi:DDE_Tnp_1-associated